jgi:serine phosphatase RsbU (regulator of sigma subunit)/pSer/pThr/pTyr-binding forkhead associated (FHA) protein
MPTFALDIQSAAGPARVPLAGQSLIVGRAREAQVFLDSRTISRRHAELVCDPFGRWWVRDLGSHNGTLVNGQRVTEQLLKPGDALQVGEFTLAFRAEDAVAPPPASPDGGSTAGGKVALVDAGGRVASLRDFDAPRIAAGHLSTLSDFGQQLLTLPSPADRLTALCALMIRPEFHGRSAMALRAAKDSFTDAPKPLCAPRAAPGDETLSPYISRTLLRTLLARNEPVLASNAAAAGGRAVPGAAAANMAELSMASDVMTIAAVACPIKSEPNHTDLLYVLFPPEYGTSEWLALVALAVKQFQQAESTWAARKLGEDHAAIERELSRAHAIQKRLVPRDVVIPGVDFAIGFLPCRWVGGDYVDIVRGPAPGGGERVLVTIADVCGKGLPAALVASSLHMMTHTAMRAGMPLPQIMQNLNLYLCETLADGTFVTMLAAMLDPASGTLEVINAGHPPGYFLSPAGDVQATQQAANMPLGLDPAAELLSEHGALPPGSYLVLYTDGLSELALADGTLLGEEALAQHLAALVKAAATPTSTDLSAKLTSLLDSLQDGMSRDDRTFLVVRRT